MADKFVNDVSITAVKVLGYATVLASKASTFQGDVIEPLIESDENSVVLYAIEDPKKILPGGGWFD